MKSRRTTAKLLQFAEVVLFKVPKPHHRVGKFEDRWDIGVWVGFVMWTGEHFVATKNGVCKVQRSCDDLQARNGRQPKQRP